MTHTQNVPQHTNRQPTTYGLPFYGEDATDWPIRLAVLYIKIVITKNKKSPQSRWKFRHNLRRTRANRFVKQRTTYFAPILTAALLLYCCGITFSLLPIARFLQYTATGSVSPPLPPSCHASVKRLSRRAFFHVSVVNRLNNHAPTTLGDCCDRYPQIHLERFRMLAYLLCKPTAMPASKQQQQQQKSFAYESIET